MCRVQNQTNVITWQFNQGDPSPININVVNSNNATLNGVFSIASFVNVSQEVRCLVMLPFLRDAHLHSHPDFHRVSVQLFLRHLGRWLLRMTLAIRRCRSTAV